MRAAGAAGLLPRVTSTLRTRAHQERLYRRYLQGLQPYPVARPGTSAHEFGWAFDMIVSPMEALADVGAYWEAMGGVWGGHPSRPGSSYDPVHFEYPGWRSTIGGSTSAAETAPLLSSETALQLVEQVDPTGGVGTTVLRAVTAAPQKAGEYFGQLLADLFR